MAICWQPDYVIVNVPVSATLREDEMLSTTSRERGTTVAYCYAG